MQSRLLQLLKEKDATKDFLAYLEDRNKSGLSILPDEIGPEEEAEVEAEAEEEHNMYSTSYSVNSRS